MQLLNKGLLYLLTLGVAGYVVFAYGFMPLGSLVHPEMKEENDSWNLFSLTRFICVSVQRTRGEYE